ncbi:unnamed protein product [Sympodiomycopsis kandeliae]
MATKLNHTQHLDPYSLPFHPLPTGVPTCRATLLHYGWLHSTRQIFVDDGWDDDEERRERKRDVKIDMPLFGALLELNNGDQWVWDLGWRTDSENLPEMFRKPIAFGSLDSTDEAQAHRLVWQKGLRKESFKGIILSHAHIDHYGALDLFDPSVPVYIGQGTLKWINGGDQHPEGLKTFPSTYLQQGRQIVEIGSAQIQLKKSKIGPFEEGYDLVGDGSIWLVKAPGHCPGHLALLAHTGNDGWVFLTGDAAHHQSMYLPIPPKPFSHDTDRRSIPALFKMTPEAQTLSCMQDFPDQAWHTLSAMTRMEMEPNVMVLLGHEDELTRAINLSQAQSLLLNDWKTQGYKQEKAQEGDNARQELNSV